MRVLTSLLAISLVVVAGPLPALAQEQIDEQAIARIKMEGFQNSQVLETAVMLSDVLGPRLAGSPAYLEAAEWARERLEAMGLERAELEPSTPDRSPRHRPPPLSYHR